MTTRCTALSFRDIKIFDTVDYKIFLNTLEDHGTGCASVNVSCVLRSPILCSVYIAHFVQTPNSNPKIASSMTVTIFHYLAVAIVELDYFETGSFFLLRHNFD